MPTDELIIGVFCMIDAVLTDVKKHPQSKLYPSEVVTLMLIFSANGVITVPFIAGSCLIIATCFRTRQVIREYYAYFARMHTYAIGFLQHYLR